MDRIVADLPVKHRQDLAPAAFYLSWKAQAGVFDGWFYSIQVLELLVGAANLLLMGLNARDGMRLRKLGKSSSTH